VESSPCWWKCQTKLKEMYASDIEHRIHRHWSEWRNSQKDPTSINEARVVKYQEEKVRRSFRIFGKRTSSSELPEGWTDRMTDFVRQSDIEFEDIVSLIARFEKRFPQMINRVGRAYFECLRGNVQCVSDNDVLFE